ncbi:MAG: HlyD family efflux transporter periplasmic adaptor subunit [Planctomycetaceae bacterium]|nr:HlyD family efflux transporter periplasmic adaptor subunit [Planctomycetaceae bacterium]
MEPVSEVRKLSFKIDGVIATCPVMLGQVVKKGDLLLELANLDEQAEVAVAEKQLTLAKAERDQLLSGTHPVLISAAERRVDLVGERLQHFQKQLERVKKLIQTSVATTDELDAAQTDVEQARINLLLAEEQLKHLREFVRPEERTVEEGKVSLAEARLRLASEKLSNTRMTAPFDGTVLEILKREGEPVRILDPEPAILFADDRQLRIRAEIDERFVSFIKPGQSVQIHGRSLGQAKYDGKILSMKSLMGKKTVFSREASERKDLDVLQVFVEVPPDFKAPIGLEVDVQVKLN